MAPVPRNFLAAAAAALLVAGCAQPGQHGRGGMHGGGMMQGGTHSHEMHRHMMGGMQQMQSMQMSGNMDKDFARMMRMHHQQGMEMARMELARGTSPEMKAMAQKIIDTQQKEVQQFDEWLRKNP